MYTVELKRGPEKFLRRQSRRIQRQIISGLRKLQDDPRPPAARKLQGMKNLYRIRTGDYRIVYCVEDDKLVVLVVRIAHRKKVYKNL